MKIHWSIGRLESAAVWIIRFCKQNNLKHTQCINCWCFGPWLHFWKSNRGGVNTASIVVLRGLPTQKRQDIRSNLWEHQEPVMTQWRVKRHCIYRVSVILSIPIPPLATTIWRLFVLQISLLVHTLALLAGKLPSFVTRCASIAGAAASGIGPEPIGYLSCQRHSQYSHSSSSDYHLKIVFPSNIISRTQAFIVRRETTIFCYTMCIYCLCRG